MKRSQADLGLGAPARTERRHLVVLEDVPAPGELARPRTRGECSICPTCQEWRDAERRRSRESEVRAAAGLAEGGADESFAQGSGSSGSREADGRGGRGEGARYLEGGSLLPPEAQHRLGCGHTFHEALRHSRPCVFVGCSSSLFLDVEADGSIRHNFPDLEPDAIDPRRSCALDIADEGGGTLEDIGQLANVTRERIQQIETAALKTLRRRGKFSSGETVTLREYVDVPDERYIAGPTAQSVFHAKADKADAVDEPPARVSFFNDGADALVADSVWSMFSRWQTSRGFDCRSKNSKRMTEWRKKNPTKGMRPLVMQQPKKGTDDMTEQQKKRGDRLERVAAVVREGVTSPSEIAERLGISAANVSNALRLLRKKGALDSSAGAGSRALTPPARVAPKPARATSSNTTVATLIEKRDELRRKADVLDAAIKELSVAL